MKEASPKMEQYFKRINDEVLKMYDIAELAKKKGFDPDDEVTVPLAKNMAERVEGLISTVAPQIKGSGIAERIAELEEEYGSQDWRVALKIAEEVALEKFCNFDDKKMAIEVGIRIGFAYVTVGVVSSPIEGFVQMTFKKRKDNGKEYFSPMYSGPIRSAGGTGASVSALIIDYVRQKLGYAEYDATDKEIKRAIAELDDYHERVTNLQYKPSKDEVEFLMKHIPIQIDGDASEKIEVSNFKDLDRIEANRIRNGFCLMTAECLCLKAPKIWKQLNKWGEEFGLGNWAWMGEFVNLQKKIKAQGGGASKPAGDSAKEEIKVSPDFTYIKDLVGGRPVLTYPLRNGGFRLRYGRARTSGFSSDAINPASMIAMDNYMAIGTQMKTERPGKATSLTVCDQIDGPIVKLKDGTVKRFDNLEIAQANNKDVIEVLYLGDILINYGDMLNRAHKLIPCGFVEEWWVQYLERFMQDKGIDSNALSAMLGFEKDFVDNLLKNPMKTPISAKDAFVISGKAGIPLHPRYIYYWNSITPDQFKSLYNSLKDAAKSDDQIILPDISEQDKRSLELIGIEHRNVPDEHVVIEKDDSKALLVNLGNLDKVLPDGKTVLEIINQLSDFEIKDKLGYFIGGRMGRPEKAKMRKLNGSPHMLFPVGNEGGRLWCMQSALERHKINGEFPLFYCEQCQKNTIYKVCEDCKSRTKKKYYCRVCAMDIDEDVCPRHGPAQPYKRMEIDIDHYFNKCLEMLKTRHYPELIKGIRGTSNQEHIPEHIIKGILRAKHNIYVNKEGTVRYDMTEMACTHFKPLEVGVPVEKLKEIGYTHDCYGDELKYDNQILELNAQDIILPACNESMEEGADEILFRVCNFIDDLLVSFYGLEPYYNLKSKSDLVGQLVVAMSPHTSAGIVSRIVGFSNTQGFFAHPLLHSIMRRDTDGDEAAVMLLMDNLLNFSKKFLPNSRGATQDAPLVLTSRLIPKEVDDMVFDMDVAWRYPLEFYEAAEQYKQPWDIKIEILNDNLGTEKQYEGMGFTHDTKDFNDGVRCSAYKIIPSMQEKVLGQMRIAEKLRAVDEDDVARLIIERHFMRDIKGNLRKFSMQSFRCVNCNEIFRRPPLIGKCTKCKGKIIFTISEGSVVKYLTPSIDLAKKYNLPIYLQQTLELTKNRIESVFGKDPEKQEGLNKWF